MRLRIISGELKGRYVTAFEGNNPFRPTQERVRQSVADIIKEKIENSVCADVCAGSGAFGFELISRGAARVDFIENDRLRAQKITEASVALGCSKQCTIYSKDAHLFFKFTRLKYDIIYFDPPYDLPDFQDTILNLTQFLTSGGTLLYERRNEKAKRPITKADAMLTSTRVFGGTVIEFYSNGATDSN